MVYGSKMLTFMNIEIGGGGGVTLKAVIYFLGLNIFIPKKLRHEDN
jgi:hypothetical protein